VEGDDLKGTAVIRIWELLSGPGYGGPVRRHTQCPTASGHIGMPVR
jgi:hypothetical protein